MYLGEIDPYEVGDACILMVRTSEEKVLGLVAADDDCYSDEEYLRSLRGKWISVAASRLTKIKENKVIEVLKGFDPESFYVWWDGGVDSELPVSFEKIKEKERVSSPGLRIVQELGQKMVQDHIGGNAGELEVYAHVQYDPLRLSLEDVVRQLVYAKENAQYLEEISIRGVNDGDDFEKDLEEAAFDLIPEKDQDSWTRFRTEMVSIFFSLELPARDHDCPDYPSRYVFFRGTLGLGKEYLDSFIAVYDHKTSEVVILIQGYSE